MVTFVDNVVDLHIFKYDKPVEHVNPQQDALLKLLPWFTCPIWIQVEIK